MRLTIISIYIAMIPALGYSSPREDAVRLYNRLVGVSPTEAQVKSLEKLLTNGQLRAAIAQVTEDPDFYTLALRDWISPWTNRTEQSFTPLNDTIATIIGFIRDDIPFNQILSADILYGFNPVAQEFAGLNLGEYSLADNNHYQRADTGSLNLKSSLVKFVQTEKSRFPAAAGIQTTRGFASEFLEAGTNRRAVRFVLKNFLCHDLEQLSDVSISDYHVRRDVSRTPGGDGEVYKSKCIGCHAGMDALGGAWAYHNFTNGALVHTPGNVQAKLNINSELFPGGFETIDDSWINLWTKGRNEKFGWRGAHQGSGPAPLGEYLAATGAFKQCMAKKVFERVCLLDASNKQYAEVIAELANKFAEGSFSIKKLFINASMKCVL